MSGEAFVLRGACVLDESGGFSGPLDVRVEGGIVTSMAPGLPASERSLDLAGRWLMPGVFDCHAHVGLSTLNMVEALRKPITRWAFEAARNARVTLETGVTFVRDPGGADAGIRDSIAAGLVPGPTLQVSIVLLSQTGGHGDGFLPGPGLDLTPEYLIPDYPGRPPYLADGPDEVRRATRAILRAGADWIKLCTTGGVLSEHDDPRGAEFTLEEIEAAVFEADRKGKGVLVHANGGDGIANAVRAGVTSIEHGIFLTEEQAAAMAKAGCWLVPTLAVMRDVIDLAQAGALPDFAARKALGLGDVFGDALRIARAHGVRIALGTDSLSAAMHGRNLREIALMHEVGMPVEEALLAATVRGAELCGVAATHGRIAPGYVFDAIVLDRDPSDPSVFSDPETVSGVFKGGAIVRGAFE